MRVKRRRGSFSVGADPCVRPGWVKELNGSQGTKRSKREGRRYVRLWRQTGRPE